MRASSRRRPASSSSTRPTTPSPAGASWRSLPRHPNLLVMRTAVQARARRLAAGALIGPAAWLEQLDKVRLPYNVSTLTQLVAGEVLQHAEVLTDQAAAIKLERGRVTRELRRMPGVTAYPSDANFILFRTTSNAERVFDGLKQRGVLIKNLHGSHRLLDRLPAGDRRHARMRMPPSSPPWPRPSPPDHPPPPPSRLPSRHGHA